MPRKVVVLHGCCKGDTDPGAVLREGKEAAANVGVNDAIAPYYTCALNGHSLSVGHDIPIHDSCPASPAAMTVGDHDDTFWENELLSLVKRLDDPRQELITGMGFAADSELASAPPAAQPMFWLPWFARGWADVHVFLNHRGGRHAVWGAIREDFDGLGEYVLIAHSLGSLIAAHLIGNEMIRPAALVTVGSQLGWATLIDFNLLPVFRAGFPWVNVIDRQDRSSGFFCGDLTPADNGYGGDPYEDVWVDNLAGGNHHDLVGYLATAKAQDVIMPLIAG